MFPERRGQSSGEARKPSLREPLSVLPYARHVNGLPGAVVYVGIFAVATVATLGLCLCAGASEWGRATQMTAAGALVALEALGIGILVVQGRCHWLCALALILGTCCGFGATLLLHRPHGQPERGAAMTVRQCRETLYYLGEAVHAYYRRNRRCPETLALLAEPEYGVSAQRLRCPAGGDAGSSRYVYVRNLNLSRDPQDWILLCDEVRNHADGTVNVVHLNGFVETLSRDEFLRKWEAFVAHHSEKTGKPPEVAD